MGKLRNQKRKKTSKKKINVGKAVLFDVFTQEKNNKNEEGSTSFTTGSEKEKLYYQMAMQGRQQQLKEEEEQEEEEMQLNQVMIFSPTKNKTSLKNKSPRKKIQFIDPYSKLPQEVTARTHSHDDDDDTDDANDADDDMEKEVTYSYTNVVREVSSPMKQSISKASKYRKSISMTFSPARHDSNAFKEETPQSKTNKDVLIFSPGRSHVSNEKGET